MNSKLAQTLEMAELLENGWTLPQISLRYGVSVPAINGRFARLGVRAPPPPPKPLAAAVFDKDQLENLYNRENTSLQAIARAFGVSVGVVISALEAHGIARRTAVKSKSVNIERLEKLRIGNEIVIESRLKNPRAALREAARRIGIIILVERLSGDRAKITRIDPHASRLSIEMRRIDRRQLENRYAAARQPLRAIAAAFAVQPPVIARALKFYNLPKRPALKCGGKHIDVFRKMEIGETAEIRCAAKYPITNLHVIAKRIPVRISIRRPRTGEDGVFTVTRTG